MHLQVVRNKEKQILRCAQDDSSFSCISGDLLVSAENFYLLSVYQFGA
jgi:hypothetical protein